MGNRQQVCLLHPNHAEPRINLRQVIGSQWTLVSGIKDENGRCNSRPEKTMNDSPSVRQIERGSYAPHYRKSSAWIFLSSDDSKSSASSFPSGGGPEASVDLCLSLLTSGEAARDDAGAGDEIPQGFLIKIGNHEVFRRTFCPTSLDHCVLCNRRINQFGHEFTLSPSMATKFGMY
jgi:hypothetical protein